MTTNNKNTPITPYERPSQKWQCGKKDCGKACVNGPSNRGRCQTTHECQPVKVEDRWHCNRPLTHGGECENGPLSDGTCCLKVEPCKPKLSQRHYRIRAGLLALLLSLIVLTAFIMTKGEHGFFMPGDLHAAHSTAGQNCTSCHASTHPLTDTHQSALPLADAGAKTETGIALSIEPMNTNCVACHSDKTFAAHDLAPSLSAAKNHQTTTNHLTSTKNQTTTKNQTQTACLDCHQAHQGNTAHLGALELSNCQTCHVAIEGLSQGHPEFLAPAVKSESSRSIKFSHQSHRDEHFPSTDITAFTCESCHTANRNTGTAELASFNASCGSCHEDETSGKIGKSTFMDNGLILWSLPSIDIESIDTDMMATMPSSLRNWPNPLEDERDIAVSDIHLMLLEWNRQSLGLIQKIMNEDLGLDDLSEADESTIKALAAFTQSSLNNVENYRFGELKLPENFSRLASSLPGSDNELALEDAEKGEAYINELRIEYRPTGHADPLLRTLYETLLSKERSQLEQSLIDHHFGGSAEGLAGVCSRCHNVDTRRIYQDRNTIWKTGKYPSLPNKAQSPNNKLTLEKASATHHLSKAFKHSTHWPGKVGVSCTDCHQMSFETDASEPAEPAQCSRCHNEDLVGETCLSCHQYHTTTP